MAYVGNSPTQQSFTGGVDQYNGNNSNTAFGLTRTINTVYDVDVYVENVWQRPATGYTVSANTITFTSAPPAGSNNVVVVYRNFSATSIVPQQGSVVHTAFAANAVPAALGYIPANKAGDVFSGAVSGITTLAAGNTTITGTLSASANVNLDSGTLVVDGTNNRVGVGTATPSEGLTVANNNIAIRRLDSNIPVFSVISASAEGYYPSQIQLFRSNTSGGATYNSTTIGEIRFDGIHSGGGYNNMASIYVVNGGNQSGGAPSSMVFTTASAGAQAVERLRINNEGTVILANGQIKFPATQNASSDANTLDDYEEGTWTPTWSTGTATYGSRAARYTKIGNVVYYNCKIESTNVTSMSTVAINGLPFAASSENAQGYVTGSTFCVVGFESLGSAGIAPQIIPGGTQIQLYIVTQSSGANYTSVDASHVNEGSTINLTVTGFYFV